MNSLSSTLKRHWVSLLLITALAVGVSIAVTAFQPFEYRSGFSVLVIEKSATGDAFAAAKSAERASLSLGQILFTTSFYDQVRDSGLVDLAMFPEDETARRQMWEKQIETRVLPDVGMMKIATYHEDRQKAAALAFAVATVLTKTGSDYLGTGDNIVLKVVDAPLTSKTPVRPNIPVNLALGFLVGFGGTLAIQLVRGAQQTVSQQREAPVAQPQPQYQPVAQPLSQQPAQAPWQPPMPVVTTMFSPQAVARLNAATTPQPQPYSHPQPYPQPVAWEMPDVRRSNSW